MKMQKNAKTLAAVMLLIIGVLAAAPGVHATTVTVASSADGALTMQNLAVSPQPIVAGSNVTISFNLFNSYDNSLYDLSLQLTGDSRILNVSPMSNLIINSIGSGNYGGVGFNTVSYKLHIPSTLPGGVYTFDVVATYRTDLPNNQGSIIGMSDMPVSIYVYGKPNVVASVVSATPSQLFPGGNQTIEVELQNTGTGTAKNVTATFINGNGVITGGINRFFIGAIPPGSSVVESLFIQAPNASSAVGSSVAMPVSISYSSNYTQNITSNQSISINVQRGPIFSIQGAVSNLKKGDAYDPVTYIVKNIGNIAANNVSFSLVTNYPISPVDPNAFVSSLAPGQSANVTFYVSIDSHAGSGSYPVTIYEQWRQSNAGANQQFSGSSNYYALVGGALSSAGAPGINEPTSTGTTEYEAIIVILVVVLIMAYVARRMRATSKSQGEARQKKK
ncbi:MAG: hypothetical protein M1500_01485 [Candidatus Marsarchaeota archaeon]|nr:hypothetical protein [Candidatus Marsarchaeota archaeon]